MSLMCDFCDNSTACKTWETQRFPYAYQGGYGMLEVKVPVYECSSCKFAYTDHEGEQIREAAMQQVIESSRKVPAITTTEGK